MATPASANLYAKFVTQATKDLYAKFEAQATKDLYAKFEAQATAALYAKFEAQVSLNLGASFDVGQNWLNLKSLMVIRHANTHEVYGEFILINDTGVISQGLPTDVLQALGIIS